MPVTKTSNRKIQNKMVVAKNDAGRAKSGECVAKNPGIFLTSRTNDSFKRARHIMTTLPKTLLAISVTGLATGCIINFGGLELDSWLPIVLPLGAVAFGAFLIFLMLEKEMANFDEEQAKKSNHPHNN
jgi:hypothetical protein